MKRIFCLLLTTVIIGCKLFAQTVSWVITPGAYDNITPYGVDLYQVSTKGRVGIVGATGRTIVPVECMKITEFFNGLAIALGQEGGQNRVLGILDKSGNYIRVTGTYYTIPGQEFFSEGYLTVTSPNGRAGYMNTSGVVEHEYEDDYVAPFSDGYAMVGRGEYYRLVDKRFKEVEILLPTNEDLAGGTNVYNGEAIVWAGESKCFRYNVRSGNCKKYRVKDEYETTDYLQCLTEISGRSEIVPFDPVKTASVKATPVSKQGKYGYTVDGKELISCQFDKAENCLGNVAIVTYRGQVGLLQLNAESQPFEVKTVNSEYEYIKGDTKNLEHVFILKRPDEWKDQPLEVTITDAAGTPIVLKTKDNDTYVFEITPAPSGHRDYVVDVKAQGLTLCNTRFSCSYKGKAIESTPVQTPSSPLSISVKMANTTADRSNHCRVVATVRNPNAKAVTARVSFKGTEHLNATTVAVTIPAYGSKEVETYFDVRKVVKGQSVTVTSSAGGSATLSNLQLIPF